MVQHEITDIVKVKVIDGEVEPPASHDYETGINDRHFIGDLDRLKRLRSFLMGEAVSVKDATAGSFGRLNLLRYKRDGRAPEPAEWSDVEDHTRALFDVLTEPQRRRFVFGEVPTWLAMLPIGLALVATVALILAIVNVRPYWDFVCYVIWLMSLGALGAVAFIGINALYVQHDVTFNVTNLRLTLLRITLGAIFGLVLTLPFGFSAFQNFTNAILKNGPLNWDASDRGKETLALLLPFILGFSTPLVITVLNRLVDAAHALFGRTGMPESTQGGSAAGGRNAVH
jgi:hypothetical protein